MAPTAFPIRRSLPERNSLLREYAAHYGRALRRRQSDVTLRAAKIEAELAYQARGAFLASMNHELRTPLNAISGFAGLLKELGPGGVEPEQQATYLDYILQSSDLLLSHINTILEIADAESGGAKLSRRAIDLVDLLTQIVSSRKAEAPGSSLDIDVPERLPPVNADPDKIAAAVGHLVSFLLPEEGEGRMRLTVRQGVAGKSARWIYVSLDSPDAVHGEAEIEEALRVFDHIHEGLYRRFDPAKLGLAIAKSYIELNGGRFNYSVPSDHGLRVRFALPLAEGAHAETYERLAS